MSLEEEFRINVLAYAITAGVAGMVLGPILYFIRARRLLPLQWIRQGYWSGAEVWFAFIVFLLIPSMCRDLLEELGFFQLPLFNNKAPTLIHKDIWAAPFTLLFTLASLFFMLFTGSKTRPLQLGLTWSRWPPNVFLGYGGFLVLTPLVLGLYFLILLLSTKVLLLAPPDAHPLEDLSKESLLLSEWGLIFFRAALAAALLEEVMFRGVLQGWLRRASFGGHVTMMIITLALGLVAYLNTLVRGPDDPPKEPNIGPLCFAIVMAVGYGFAVYRVWSPVIHGEQRWSWQADSGAGPDVEQIKETGFSEVVLPGPPQPSTDQQQAARQRWRQWERKNALLAILGSSMIFAAFHSMVWPSPIPLFFLGLGLGYLAYRTQNLLPGIVLHGLFNTLACVVLVLANAKG